MEKSPDAVEQRLQGTRAGAFWREFFTNSAHFPLANILLELLLEGPGHYLREPDAWVLLAAATVQAGYLSRARFRGRPRPLLGNLLGPLLYSAIEVAVEGPARFLRPNHVAYWLFALAVGLLQKAQSARGGRGRTPLLLAENVIRAAIVAVLYALIEYAAGEYGTVAAFLEDPAHIFILLMVPLLGLLIGLAQVTSERYLATLRRTAEQLREYSEWLLGRDLLARAVADPEALDLRRHHRAILFMDIRGFTAWSEQRQPEEVVTMVNTYYEAAEAVWRRSGALKAKLTADEVMLVFAGEAAAVAAARALQGSVAPVLERHGLAAGIGVHAGAVVEGLLGPRDARTYDLLGDAVNTASRLCQAAGPGEVLLSDAVAANQPPAALGPTRRVPAKGKTGLNGRVLVPPPAP
ncbi:MAG TPA: adenylate/guanylate cyclase domain-containing protein, partial [Gammaproteobacteria bacterium]|nr:adenylate/guanylate cyclase domain-containing protein [Gammaproteobacteria bacterium]